MTDSFIPAPLAPEPAAQFGGPKKKRKWPWIVGGVLAVIILVPAISAANNPDKVAEGVAAAQSQRAEPKPAAPKPVDTRVVVPGMTGMTVAEAVAALAAVNITLDLPADVGQDWIVSSQTVAGGGKIEPGAPLSISAAPPAPVYTVAQENAIEEALSYLNYSDFSRAGLFDQLTSEYGAGFEAADAEFAIATVEQTGQVDWNAEAVEAAKSYMDYSSFSRDGLYDQLTSEYGGQFTPEQANVGLAAVGY